jgi:hypothetical protein
MANPNSPFGLRPVGNMDGAPFTGGLRHYSMAAGDAVAAFIGDPVKLTGAAQTIDGEVYSDVAQAATGDVVVGVIVAVLPVTRESTIYRAASTQRIVLVADAPDTLFEIQEVSGGTALAANDIGLNANFVVGTGSTVTGLSGVELNNATEATTNTLDLKIVGLARRQDNAIGANAKYLVRINRHQYANQVAGV